MFNETVPGSGMSDPKHVFQALCDEAARACPSGDMAEIERYVARRLADLDEPSRRVVAQEVRQVLGFRAPDCPTFEQ